MGLRPAKCYHWDSPAYTRKSKNPADSFITGIPGTKLTHYNMGNMKEKFDTEVSVVSDMKIQIRHNALEAARIATNKILEENLGVNNYHFKVRVVPHHVMRENVMATGAGADRVQSGMRGAFGKPMGFAARINKNQAVFTVFLDKTDDKMKIVKRALKIATSKLPGDMKIVIKPANA